MPRIRPLTKEEVTPETGAILEKIEHFFGEPVAPAGVQAYCPPILEAGQILGAAPARSAQLRAQIRSLICLYVAQLVGCRF